MTTIEADPADLLGQSNGRERIVTAALELFAERGPDGVSVRDVAATAGVSLALIPHHFGTKAGLKAAVDDHVSRIFDALLEQSIAEVATAGDGAIAESFAELLLHHLPQGSPVPAYLRRMLLAGDPAGRAFFRQWFELSQTMMAAMDAAGLTRPSNDPDVRAAFLMVNDLALVLLHEHIADAIGIDPLTPAGLRRWTVDVVDAYSDGVFTKEKA